MSGNWELSKFVLSSTCIQDAKNVLRGLQKNVLRYFYVISLHSKLQKALEICQRELENLDMSINAKKTCCLRIGPRASAIEERVL